MVSIKVPWNYTSVVYLILSVGNNVSPIGRKFNSTIQIMEIPKTTKWAHQPTMTISTASCESRWDEALLLLKSCLLVSPNSPIKFIIFTDRIEIFQSQLLSWKNNINELLQYEIYKPILPKDEDWSTYCNHCSCQRLFLPELLPHIDSLIHVDADCILLSPVETLWKHFNEFNSTQIIGMGPDHENYRASHYGKAANHPFYGKSGLNAGVLLMNLTRMRAFNWSGRIRRVYRRWGELYWYDQAFFNLIFRIHTARLYLLYCSANFLGRFCEHDPPDCTAAVRGGIQVMHGTGESFHSGRHPAFTTVLNVTKQFQLGTDRTTHFFQPLLKRLKSDKKKFKNSTCVAAIIASIKINKWAN